MKPLKIITDLAVLYALNNMAASVYTSACKRHEGIHFGLLSYGFYSGKLNRSGTIGLISLIVLSSQLKVYKITDITKPVKNCLGTRSQHERQAQVWEHLFGEFDLRKRVWDRYQACFSFKIGLALVIRSWLLLFFNKEPTFFSFIWEVQQILGYMEF